MFRLICALWVAQICLLCSASAAILIKGGTVVNADHSFASDVLIEGSKIAAVGKGLKAPQGATVLDASGKLVIPGGIDPHTHLGPFLAQAAAEEFYSGHKAALAGGTTFHIDFVLPKEGDLLAGLAHFQDKAQDAMLDYGFHMAINTWSDKVSAQMPAIIEAGINSFKFFFAYKGALAVGDDLFLDGLQRSKELGALPMVHGENADAIVWLQQQTFDAGITGPEGHSISRPAFIEGEGTGRAVRLARAVNAPLYVVHVMSKDAADEIARGLQAGQRLWGEALAGGIAITEDACWDPNFKKAAAALMSPPLRSREHRDAIRAALAGGQLQLIGTDHCGWNSTQKAQGRHDFRKIPNGIHGLEERLHVAWETLVNPGLITPSDFVRLTSTEAAKIFNVYPAKGVIQPGSDADVVIFDPTEEHTLSSAVQFSALDTTIYEGMHIRGKVKTTISRGRLAFHKDEILLEKGSGRYVKLPPWAPAVFGGQEEREKNWIQEMFPYGKTPVKRKGDRPSTGSGSGSDEL